MQDKAPVSDVLAPGDGEAFVFGQEVYFAAEVLDYQDGSLSGGNVTWRDQTDFLLGSGTEFSQDNLLIGENVITVMATSSAGLSTTATFSIFVDDELELPPATLTVGPDQVGWHVGDGETALQSATVSVANSGDDTFSVAITENVPWLSVSQSDSDTPLELTLTADPAYLESGQRQSTMLQSVKAVSNSMFSAKRKRRSGTWPRAAFSSLHLYRFWAQSIHLLVWGKIARRAGSICTPQTSHMP